MSQEARGSEPKVRIAANPVCRDAKLILWVNGETEAEVKIYDVRGRLIVEREIKVKGRRVEVPIVMREAGSGVYFYEVDMLGKRYRGRFVKVR